MTNNSPLDEHIKKAFGDYSPDVPPHVWENIVAGREKRRPAGLWFGFLNRNVMLVLLTLLVAGGGLIIYKYSSNAPASQATAVNNDAGKDNNNTDNNKTTGTNTTVPSTPTTENIKPAETVAANTDTKDQTSTSQINTVSTEDNNNRISSATNKTTDKISNTKNGLGKFSGKNIQSNIPATITDTEKNDAVTNKKNKKQSKTKGSSVVSYTTPETESIEDLETETVSSDLFMNRHLLNLDIARAKKNTNTSIIQSKNPHLDIPCPEAEKDAAGNKRYFEIYAGPDYAFSKISDTGNSAYLQKRKESMSFSSAFSAGFRYTKVFGNGMSFRTGLNYSQINEKFKYVDGNYVQMIYIIDNNGDTTGSYTATGTRYKTTYNKFRTIDVPLLIGYEMGNGRWHANINAGAMVNLYSWQKGDVLDTAYKPVNITTGKEFSPYQFKTNVGIGFLGSISVYYKLNDRLHILAEPYFRYSFTAASKSDLTLRQKYNTVGLRLGVRLDF